MSTRSIGEVLAALRQDFPDVSISKIRFLEAEGLVEPERTPAGYRKFSAADIERLSYVLRAQRDQYLPLRVIKEHLDAIDRGLEPPQVAGAPRVPETAMEDGDRNRTTLSSSTAHSTTDAGLHRSEDRDDVDALARRSFSSSPTTLRLSRRELCEAAGIEDALLKEVESYGLITAPSATGHYDRDALLVARTVGELARFGVEPRHLRPFRTAAERQAGLVEQATAPILRHRGPDAQARAEEATRELTALTVRLHALLVKAAVERTPGR